jgi:putative transposase
MRWGRQPGYCVVSGQKVPLQRPRVRDTRQREIPLGSYAMLQQSSLLEDAVWHKIMHGLTTRRYSAVVRELQQAYGVEKSANPQCSRPPHRGTAAGNSLQIA